jgi:hypothetical protein
MEKLHDELNNLKLSPITVRFIKVRRNGQDTYEKKEKCVQNLRRKNSKPLGQLGVHEIKDVNLGEK